MKIQDVHYIPFDAVLLNEKLDDLTRYLRLTAEFGCSEEGQRIFDEFLSQMNQTCDRFQTPVLSQQDPDEPDSLDAIRLLRPDGPRKISGQLPKDYPQRLAGAFYGRMIGCTLGAALEFVPAFLSTISPDTGMNVFREECIFT